MRKIMREFPLHVMLIPSLAIILVYSYYPMLGLVIAFQKFNPFLGMFESQWVGLDNFTYLLSLPDTMQVLWNTLFIAVLKIIAGLIMPIATAILLNEIRLSFVKRSVQTLIYLPHFLSWIILGGILIDILSPSQGIVNQMLGVFGIGPIFFLGDVNWFPYVLVISDVWKEFGFGTIVFLSALTAINPTLYEAAYMDGAGRVRQVFNITLPGMMPIIILMATLSLGNVLNAGFEQVLILYSPSVYASGDILDTMIYRVGLQNAQYGIATALGLFKSVVTFIMISFAYWSAYRFANYRIF